MTRGLLQLAGAVVDLVHRLDRLPASGEEVESPDVMMAAGGGFNAMAAARRAGAAVTYGGTLGTGVFAEIVARALAEEGIAIATPARVAIDQGSCVVLVEPDGERTFISHHGAERRVEPAHLDGLAAATYGWALLTGYALYKPESAGAFLPWLDGLPRPPKLFFDPGPVAALIPPSHLAVVLRRADWVSANAAEASSLTGLAAPGDAARALAETREGALVRCGAGGCWLATGGTVDHVAGFSVAAIDTTGAGDTHAGAFIAGMLAGFTARDAAVFANAAAALSTTRAGPATAPAAAEIHRFLHQRGISPGTAPATASQPRRATTGR